MSECYAENSPLLPVGISAEMVGTPQGVPGFSETPRGGGGAGLLLYGSLDSPLQSIDIEQCAACVNDAGMK